MFLIKDFIKSRDWLFIKIKNENQSALIMEFGSNYQIKKIRKNEVKIEKTDEYKSDFKQTRYIKVSEK